MRAMVIDSFGGGEQFRLADVPMPAPSDDEILIQVACAAVNPIDWKERIGILAQGPRARSYSFPHVLGCDASGIVAAVGRGVTGAAPGQRVVTCGDGPGPWGSYAEYVVVRGDRAGPMPASLSFREAAAYPLAALTIRQDLFAAEKGGLKRGQWVLIHGGAGGLGSYGVQMAKAAGLRVAATCRSANTGYVESLKVDLAIDYQTEDVRTALLAWRPGGVDVIVDAVGGATLPQAYDMLRPGGRLVSVATLTSDGDIAAHKAEAEARGLSKVWAIMSFEGLDGQLADIAAQFDAGKLRSPPLTVFPLEQVAQSHALMETGHVRGKIVLDVANLEQEPR